MVDTLGLLLTKRVEPEDVQDRTGPYALLSELALLHPRIITVLADGEYISQKLADWLKSHCGWILEIVKRTDDPFRALKKRWIVERTFAWFNLSRRLSKDYEFTVQSSETFLELCMIRIMLRRLAVHTASY